MFSILDSKGAHPLKSSNHSGKGGPSLKSIKLKYMNHFPHGQMKRATVQGQCLAFIDPNTVVALLDSKLNAQHPHRSKHNQNHVHPQIEILHDRYCMCFIRQGTKRNRDRKKKFSFLWKKFVHTSIS